MRRNSHPFLRLIGLGVLLALVVWTMSPLMHSNRLVMAHDVSSLPAVSPLNSLISTPHAISKSSAASAGTPIARPQQSATPTRTPTPINVGDFVWDDLDQDGRQDAGEPGLGGVTVQLWNGGMTQLIGSAVTSGSGAYTLIAPVPGPYRVRVLLPSAADQFSPRDNAAAGDQLDSDINASGVNTGFTEIYNFASNLISITTIDAGIIKYRPPTATRTPTPINIGNFVWYDINANGLQDAGEPGISSVTVQLWNANKTQLLASTVTTNGAYTLIAQLPGDYRVRVIPPSGASLAPKDQGANNLIDSDVNPSGMDFGFTDVFTIASNVISITTIDAGLLNVPATPSPSNTATVTNTPTATHTPIVTDTPTTTHTPLVTDTPTTTIESTAEALFVEYIYLPMVRN